MIGQALRTIFRFRDSAQPERPLSDSLDYELLRMWLRSGETIAETFYGPMRFNSFGQNVGKQPTSMQVLRPTVGEVLCQNVSSNASVRARIVLPFGMAKDPFVYPAPSVGCPLDAYILRFDASVCPLCPASECDRSSWWDRNSISLLAGGTSLATTLVLFAACVPAIIARHAKHARQLQELQQRRLRFADGRIASAIPTRDPLGCHIFISYTWTTAADRVRIIKDRIGDTLPDLRVFLDTDDLARGTGEGGVIQADTVLIFLSEGYCETHAHFELCADSRSYSQQPSTLAYYS